jgi:signal transduction histidine kinase/ActR/RegA family two-component response regulator
MAFFSRQVRDPDPELLQMLASVGGQIGQFIDRTRAEEALRESNRRLEEAVKELQSAQHQVVQQERLRALGQMAGGIAHDFNNALAPILGFSELLLARPQSLTDTAKVRHYLETMNTAARDAAAVVRRLREFYRPREESEVFLPVNLNELVNQAIAMTRPRWKDQAMGSGAGIRMNTELARVPVVAGVASELREVLTNLIFNAVDAMPHGGTIAIRTRLDNSSVVLEVTDSGVGMTDEVREHCLDPFYSTKGERGTGLGLSIVYGIVRRHEGSVEFESEPGCGTTFRIKLPAQTGAPAVAATLSSNGPSKRLNILLVDDEPLVREIQTEYLTGEGHRVDSAPDGQQAIHLFASGRFDVVITDQAMPGMTGDQVAAAIKQMSPLTPVILLTGFGDMMLATGEKPAGVDLVLSKPISISGLRDAVEKLCAEKTVRRPVTNGEPVGTPA